MVVHRFSRSVRHPGREDRAPNAQTEPTAQSTRHTARVLVLAAAIAAAAGNGRAVVVFNILSIFKMLFDNC